MLEPRFGAELFATLLSIPANKTLLRRHLSTHFVALIGGAVQQQKREAESQPGFIALTLGQKVKVSRIYLSSQHVTVKNLVHACMLK